MVRFAIVGTGRISDWVLCGAVLDARFKATAVCSRSEHTADAFMRRHPECFTDKARSYTDIEDCVNDPEVDAVYIGTPNTTHLRYALEAISAGKHVLCEKPLACSTAEVEQMISAAGSRGVVLMEAMISPLQPAFSEAVKRLQQIGPLRQISFNFNQYSTKYEALQRGELYSSTDPAMGGGALEDVGIYTVYPLVTLLGKPGKVKACGFFCDTAHGDVEMSGCACLGYGSEGATASLSWSKVCDSGSPSEICGEKGTIRLDNIHSARKSWIFPHAAPTSGRGDKAGGIPIYDSETLDSYYYEFREFIDVIESGSKESSVNTLQASLTTRQVMDMIIASAKENR